MRRLLVFYVVWFEKAASSQQASRSSRDQPTQIRQRVDYVQCWACLLTLSEASTLDSLQVWHMGRLFSIQVEKSAHIK
jgi:hypothetical protein